MQSYRKVAGKLFNQAPYEPKLFQYHGVIPIGFAKQKPQKKYQITENTAKVQGKLMNAGVYDPKLNKFGITPQNYQKQLEKVQADIAVKNELTDKVTEAASGDRMQMEKKRRDYTPLIESLTQAGVVISQAIRSPADMSKLVKDTLLTVTKNYPRSEWARRLPEALKMLSMQIMEGIKAGVIAPDDVPEIIADIERDPELDVEVDVIEDEEMSPEQFRNVLVGTLENFVKDMFRDIATVPEALDKIEKLFPDFLENEEAEVFQSIADEMGLDFDKEINNAFFTALTSEANKIEFAPRREAFVNIIRRVFTEDNTPDKEDAIRMLGQAAFEQFAKVFINTDIYDRFESKVIAGLMSLFDTDTYARAATTLSNKEATLVIEGALNERANAKSAAKSSEKSAWVNRFISKIGEQYDDGAQYLRDAIEKIFSSRLTTREVEEPEDIEPLEDPEDYEPPEEFEPPETSTKSASVSYDTLLELGLNIIENAEEGSNWVNVYNKLFSRGPDSIMSQLIANGVAYKDRQDALGTLRRELEDRMTELGVPEEVFDELGLARSENRLIIAESAPGAVTYGDVTLNPDGSISVDDDGGGIVGQYANGTLSFMDATGNTRKYKKFSRNQLEELFTNGGPIMDAISNGVFGTSVDYKSFDIDGAYMPNVFDIVKMYSRAKQSKITFDNGTTFSIKKTPKTVILTPINPLDEKPTEEAAREFNRDAFFALIRVLTDTRDTDERHATIMALKEFDTDYYGNAYRALKNFFGSYAGQVEGLVGFGRRRMAGKPKGKRTIKKMPVVSTDGVIREGDKFIDGKTRRLKAKIDKDHNLIIKIDGKVHEFGPLDNSYFTNIYSNIPFDKRPKLSQDEQDIQYLIFLSQLEDPDRYADVPVTHSVKGSGSPGLFNAIVSQLDKKIKGGAITKKQYIKVMRQLARE